MFCSGLLAGLAVPVVLEGLLPVTSGVVLDDPVPVVLDGLLVLSGEFVPV